MPMIHVCFSIHCFPGEDYEASEQRLVFQPGVKSLSVPIRIFNDFIPEPPEIFALNLFKIEESPTVSLDGNSADVLITDDDGI